MAKEERGDPVEFKNQQKRPTWDETWMTIAEIVAQRSTCCHLKVGVVFVRDKKFLQIGYNGPPTGEPHCREVGCAKMKDGQKISGGSGLCRGAHAETNAIANASSEGVNLKGSTIYCTLSPCFDCAKVLVNLKIKEFVYLKEYKDEGQDNGAKALFERHRISLRKIDKSSFLVKPRKLFFI